MSAPVLLGGRYQIRGVLGQGGMATVYDGWDVRLGRPVAIKVLHPGFNAHPEYRARIDFEARSAAALNHPNIVVVHDSGDDSARGGAPYLIMERLPGRSLLDAIVRGPLTPDQVRAMLSEVLAGLCAAHAAGIVHRDIKPANVLFGAEGEAKIADFGVAKTGGNDLTRAGQVVGTMAYLSPERLAGQPATPLDDLYAVGALGYEALTGRMPFPQSEPAALVRAIAEHHLPPLLAVRPDVDPALATVIDRAMAPNLAQRFPNAETMRAALYSGRPPTRVLTAPLAGSVLLPRPPSRRRKTLAALAIAAVLLLVLSIVVVESTGSPPSVPETPTTSQTTTPTTTVTSFELPGNGNGNGGSKKPKHGDDG